MEYTDIYNSPLGDLLLSCDDMGLTGVWNNGQSYYARNLGKETVSRPEHPVLQSTRQWLDAYFAGCEPGQLPPMHPRGTDFQQCVWKLLLEIPRGQVTTYGQLASQVAEIQGSNQMSAQAIGGAVGRNPIGILVPCHRVIGADGTLTGYAGGLDRKEFLLRLEGYLK